MNLTPISYEASKNSSGLLRNPMVSTNIQLILRACVPISDDTHNHNPVRLKSVMVVRYAKFAKSNLFPLAIAIGSAILSRVRRIRLERSIEHRALDPFAMDDHDGEPAHNSRAARIAAFKRER